VCLPGFTRMQGHGRFDSVTSSYLAMSEALLPMFKINSFVKHKEQSIQGRVVSSNHKDTTIYDQDCPDDDDPNGSYLTFRNYDLEPIS